MTIIPTTRPRIVRAALWVYETLAAFYGDLVRDTWRFIKGSRK